MIMCERLYKSLISWDDQVLMPEAEGANIAI